MLVLALVAACDDAAPPPAAPEPLTASFTDLGAPARVAALELDAQGRPIVFAADSGAGPWRLMRLDGDHWTESDVTSPTSDVKLLRDPDGSPIAVSFYDVYRLDDDAAFTWQKLDVPDPPISGAWEIIGEDASGRFAAEIEGATISLATWFDGDHDWATMTGSSQVGYEQGTLVTPDGTMFMSFSPIGAEDFNYERFADGPPEKLSPCNGLGLDVVADNGVSDADSNVYFESCDHAALYVIPAGGTCYQPVVAMPDGVCGVAKASADGYVFVFPSSAAATSAWRWHPGETAWTEIGGDMEGSQAYVATDGSTLYRFGGALPGLARGSLDKP